MQTTDERQHDMTGIPTFRDPTRPMASAIPREDWDRAPWNRWTFQHVREIVPTVQVWRGPGPASDLPAAFRDIDAIDFELDGRRDTIAGFLATSFNDGLLVLHRGKVVAERYQNGMEARTAHLSQSVAKSVVGTVAGILIGRGLVDPLAPVTEYLPELKATAYRGATVQHVLDMTSGVVFDETYTALDSHMAKIDAASGWKERRHADWPTSVWELILTLTEAECAHGASFRYRSIETDVLAFCMERASGRRLPELVSEFIWQPMGADESACFTLDRAGYAMADGGLNATLRDYARFGALYLHDGFFNGRQIVPADWVKVTRIGDAKLFGEPYTLTTPNGAYRNQFWIEDVSRPAIMCRGVFGQLIYIDAARDLVLVKLSSWPDFLNIEFGVNTLRMIHALANELA